MTALANQSDPDCVVNYNADQPWGLGRLHRDRMLTQRCSSAGLWVIYVIRMGVSWSQDRGGGELRRYDETMGGLKKKCQFVASYRFCTILLQNDDKFYSFMPQFLYCSSKKEITQACVH